MPHRIICLIVLLSCLAVPTWAGIQPRSFTLSPMVGGYLFEGNQSLEHSLFGSLGLGYNLTRLAALEAVFLYAQADANDSSTTDTTVKSLRLDALYHFSPNSELVPYFAVGMGGITLNPDGAGDRDHFLVNYGAGIKYFISDSIALRADVRHLLEFRNPNHHLLYSAGLIFQFGAPAPAPKAAVVPPPPTVTPDPILTTIVAPAPAPQDSDNDGIFDEQDQCPQTPDGAAVNNAGCPLDSDSDGVFDYLDSCAATPQGVSVDSQGCPSKMTLRINFGLDSSIISADYADELTKAARCINEYPGNSVFIDGHTDNLGPADYNLWLSERRATAIKNSLNEKFNIPTDRMMVRGFGETQPVADNNSNEGLFQNRRVEISCGATE